MKCRMLGAKDCQTIGASKDFCVIEKQGKNQDFVEI